MIVCKVCGFDNETGAQFCGNCGSFLEWTGESTATEPVTPSDPGPPDATPDPVGPDAPTVVTPVPDGIVCPNCGTMNERDRVFCRHCATELAPMAAAVAPVAPPARSGPGRAAIAAGLGIVGIVVVGAAFAFGGFLGGDPATATSPSPGPTASATGTATEAPTVAPTDEPSPTPVPTPTPRPDPTGTIAWSSGPNGNYEIVTSDPDGSNLTRVFRMAGDDVQAAWSPDGTRLAFASARGIRIVDATDGGNRVLFTHHRELDRAPDFSPDGSSIVFASSRNGDFDIYLRDVGDSNLIQLTDDPGKDDDPAWSPVTNLIAFSSDRRGDRDIWTMRPDGSGLARLTGNEGNEDHPAWSPDGSLIAFTSDRGGTTAIYVMNADGSGIRRLADGSDPERHAAWSPDGAWIAYRQGTGGGNRIRVVAVDDGTEYAGFSEPDLIAAYPTWH